jgi:hypothetical protein
MPALGVCMNQSIVTLLLGLCALLSSCSGVDKGSRSNPTFNHVIVFELTTNAQGIVQHCEFIKAIHLADKKQTNFQVPQIFVMRACSLLVMRHWKSEKKIQTACLYSDSFPRQPLCPMQVMDMNAIRPEDYLQSTGKPTT